MIKGEPKLLMLAESWTHKYTKREVEIMLAQSDSYTDLEKTSYCITLTAIMKMTRLPYHMDNERLKQVAVQGIATKE